MLQQKITDLQSPPREIKFYAVESGNECQKHRAVAAGRCRAHGPSRASPHVLHVTPERNPGIQASGPSPQIQRGFFR